MSSAAALLSREVVADEKFGDLDALPNSQARCFCTSARGTFLVHANLAKGEVGTPYWTILEP